jgi:hypothetical protein
LRIRLAATAAVSGSYNSQNIVLSSTGATSVNIATAANGNIVNALQLTAPSISTITGGNSSLSVVFSAPSNANATGSAITNYKYSTDGGTTFTACSPVQTTSPLSITGLTNNTTYNVQILALNSYGDGLASNTVQGTPVPVPTINAAISFAAFTTTYGTPSSAQSLAVTGTNLTNDITATAPTGFEVSSDGTNYGATATFTQSGGSASGTLYIRLSATATVGSYNSQNIVLTSNGATNVSLTTSASGNTVTAAALTITGLTAANKTYDGGTSVSVTGSASYAGLKNGETFSIVGNPSWAFASKTVGTAKTITQTGSYSAPSSNYSITQPTLTADITAATLTITNPAVTSKTYDGSTTATITGTLNGVISPDNVTLVGSGTFASANVATGIQVTSNCSLSGTDAGNYSLTQPTGLTGNILPQPAGLLIFEENFSPTNGLLTSNGWSQIASTTTNAILTGSSNGLSYIGYGSSEIGNSAIINS